LPLCRSPCGRWDGGMDCGALQWKGAEWLRRKFYRSRCVFWYIIPMVLTDTEWGWYELHWYGSGHGQVEGSCEHGAESSGYIKFWEILE
jgi:hypothetical protein